MTYFGVRLPEQNFCLALSLTYNRCSSIILPSTCSLLKNSSDVLSAFFVGMSGTANAEPGADRAVTQFVNHTDFLVLILLDSFFSIGSALFNI